MPHSRARARQDSQSEVQSGGDDAGEATIDMSARGQSGLMQSAQDAKVVKAQPMGEIDEASESKQNPEKNEVPDCGICTREIAIRFSNLPLACAEWIACAGAPADCAHLAAQARDRKLR